SIVDGADLQLKFSEKNIHPNRDVVIHLTAGAGDAQAAEQVRFSSAVHEGAKYLMLRYRPALALENQQATSDTRKDWVFLFESSGDRNPLLARVQIDVIRALLQQAGPEDTFAVLAAGTRVHTLGAARPVTPENVQAAVAMLESAHLVGALDLGQALQHAEPFL